MSTATEPGVDQRVHESPHLSLDAVREVRRRDLAIRFVAGAGTSVVAGVLSLGLGARVGGVMLGFPAILAASLTLIAQEDDREEAREDARGAILGAVALVVFAAVAAIALLALPAALALALAALAWLGVAVAAYFALWR